MENNLSIVKNQFKELPNNIEAEQAVIGSILVSNEIYDEISPVIDSHKFFDPIHSKIFEIIENLISKGLLANHGRSDELDLIFKSYSNLLRLLGN